MNTYPTHRSERLLGGGAEGVCGMGVGGGGEVFDRAFGLSGPTNPLPSNETVGIIPLPELVYHSFIHSNTQG